MHSVRRHPRLRLISGGRRDASVCIWMCVLMVNDVSHVWIHLDSPLLAGKEAKRIADTRESCCARSDQRTIRRISRLQIRKTQRYPRTDRSVTISSQLLISSEFRFYIFFLSKRNSKRTLILRNIRNLERMLKKEKERNYYTK